MIIGVSNSGDYLEFKRFALPFSEKVRNGDFIYYSSTDSVLPNPFTSVNDLIPKSRLETLTEFAVYPSCWSSLHHAAAFMDEETIAQALEKGMHFFNDEKHDNMFTLACKRDDPEII